MRKNPVKRAAKLCVYGNSSQIREKYGVTALFTIWGVGKYKPVLPVTVIPNVGEFVPPTSE